MLVEVLLYTSYYTAVVAECCALFYGCIQRSFTAVLLYSGWVQQFFTAAPRAPGFQTVATDVVGATAVSTGHSTVIRSAEADTNEQQHSSTAAAAVADRERSHSRRTKHRA